RKKDLKRARTDSAKLIEEMIDFFEPTAKTANIDIRAYLPGDLPAVPLHKEMFRQALLNLLLNVKQALPAGAQTRRQAAAVEGPAVCLNIIDTGKGMSAETLKRVF